MKKNFFLFLLLFVFMVLISSCSKNLSVREASAKDVAVNFLKSVTEGNIENAKLFVLSQLLEEESIKEFLSKKIESYEYVEEIEPLSAIEGVKNAIEKEKEKINQIKDKLDSYKKGLSKVINEGLHVIKVNENGQEKFYGIFIFSSQNLKSVTGVIEITELAKSGSIKSKIESTIM